MVSSNSSTDPVPPVDPVDVGNERIVSLAKLGRVREAEAEFENFQRQGARVSQAVYASMLNMYIDVLNIPKMTWMLDATHAAGFEHDVPTLNKLIKRYCQIRNTNEVKRIFAPLHAAGVVLPSTYDQMLQMFANKRAVEDAEELLSQMLSAKVSPNSSSMCSVIRMYAAVDRIDDAKSFLFRMKGSGYLLAPIFLTMINALKSAGRYADCHDMFTLWHSQQLPFDLDLTNAMIPVYGELDRFDDAFSCFTDAVTARPTLPSYVHALDLCFKHKRMDLVDTVLSTVRFCDRTTASMVYSKVIQLRGKLAQFEEALKLLERLKVKGIADIVIYNAMVQLYASQNQYSEAVSMYQEAVAAGLTPDAETLSTMIKVYCGSHDIAAAEAVCVGLKEEDTISLETFNDMFDAYFKQDRLHDAYNVLTDLWARGMSADPERLASLFHQLVAAQEFTSANRLFRDALEHRVPFEREAFVRLVKAFGQFQSSQGSAAEFGDAATDEAACNKLLQLMADRKETDKIKGVYHLMLDNGVPATTYTLSRMLVLFTKGRSVVDSEAIFARLHSSGGADLYDCCALLHLFIARKEYQKAELVFDKMLLLDRQLHLYTVTTMINVYSILGKTKKAEDLFAGLKADGTADAVAYTSMMNLYCKSRDYSKADAICREMAELNFADSAVCEAMIRSHIGEGNIDAAKTLFEKIQNTGTIADEEARYNTMIRLLGQARNYELAEHYFMEMQEKGLTADKVTLTTMITVYAKGEQTTKAEDMFSQIQEKSQCDLVSYNAMMNMYAAQRNADKVLALYKDISSVGLTPDAISDTTLLKLYTKTSDLGSAHDLFTAMRQNGTADAITFYTMFALYFHKARLLDKAWQALQWARDANCLEDLERHALLFQEAASQAQFALTTEVFSDILRLPFPLKQASLISVVRTYSTSQFLSSSLSNDETVCNSLIIELADQNDVDKLTGLMRKLSTTNITIQPSTLLRVLETFCRLTKVDEAIATFTLLRESNSLDTEAYTSMVNLYKRVDPHRAVALFAQLEATDVAADRMLLTSMINVHHRLKNVAEAESIFARLLQTGSTDAVSYTAMIHLYVKRRDHKKALSFYRDMCDAGLTPSTNTLELMISAYGMAGKLEDARATYDRLLATTKQTKHTYINMLMAYGRGSQITEAEQVFEDFKKFMPITREGYNAMLSVLCVNGEQQRAEQLLAEMKARGVPEDEFTLAPLLKLFCGKMQRWQAESTFAQLKALGKDKRGSYNALYIMYSRLNATNEAIAIASTMSQRGWPIPTVAAQEDTNTATSGDDLLTEQ